MLVTRWIATLLMVALGAGAIGGCGSSEDPPQGEDDIMAGGSNLEPLKIFFPEMYSAVIPGSQRLFKLPVVVEGVQADDWSAEPMDAVEFQDDANLNGKMIIMKKPGTVTIKAKAGRRTGEAKLHITEATEELYAMGEARYNNKVELMLMPGQIRTPGGMFMLQNNVSCKECHGSGANFLAVEHTPQQTGGYSDEEIRQIFSMGMKPPGATYGSLPGIENYYPLFHRWAATEEEYQGLVVYLRSLEPKSQGDLDFMGLINMFRNRQMMRGGTPPAEMGMTPPAEMGAAGSGM